MECIGQFHVDFQTEEADEFAVEIPARITKASGANYDLGSNSSGYETKAGSIKDSAASNYKSLEKEGNIGPVTYTTGALARETPVDLSGRPMVAPPTEAKKNVVGMGGEEAEVFKKSES